MIPLYDQNPTERRPVVTRLLIYGNVVAFIVTWWMSSHGVHWVAPGYGMVPARLSADPSGEAIKLLSSTFLHADIAHLGWNMLFLHIFGDNVEDALGRSRYVFFYFLAGIGGGLAQFIIDPQSTVALVGASGAIAGVLGGYMVLYPRAKVTIFNPLIIPWPFLPLPAWLVVGWWFVTNLLGGFFSLMGVASEMAYMAHLGGFAIGLLMIRGLAKPPRDSNRHDQTGEGQAERAAAGQEAFFARDPQTRREVRKKIFPRQHNGPFWR